MKIYVKNMVCNRCIMIVKQVLDRLNIPYHTVQLGEMMLISDITPDLQDELNHALQKYGFSLIGDRKARMIEKIKTIIVKMIHQEEGLPKWNISTHLADELHLDYNYLSATFSEVENITIEKYIISQKIERVKELLVYDELTLNEISNQMGYSSVAHLSNQFKKVTGLTPRYFKKVKENKRKPLDEVK